jgi:pilus assembly protein CpaF
VVYATSNGSLRDVRLSATEEREALTARVHERLVEDLDVQTLDSLPAAQRRERAQAAVRSVLAEIAPTIAGLAKQELVDEVINELLGMGPLQTLLDDADVSEIMVNGPSAVYYERNGVLYVSPVKFRDGEHIRRIAERIVAPLGRHVDEASPMVDARLPDGSRVNIVLPPVSVHSPTITIRKFRSDRFDMDDLVRIGTVSAECAAFLRACVTAKVNIVVSGGTGSGKTTLLNALSAFIPAQERIVTIEDPMEIQLRQPHVVTLEARPNSIEGRGEIAQRDLVRNSLRMRPDRIIVGEVRGAEAFDMLQAMNTGHEGSITTVHANAPRDALSRIENMVMMAGFDLPVRAIREQMASALHLIVQIGRMADGSRRMTAITEVAGLEGDVVTLQDIFSLVDQHMTVEGKVEGELRATGIRPRFTDRFAAHGVSDTWLTPPPVGIR